MTRLALGALLVALAVPGQAAAARYAIGVERGASLERVAERVSVVTCSPVSRDLAALRALVVTAPDATGMRRLPGVEYVERLDRVRRLSFAPNDPFVPRQWYLAQNRAFDAWPDIPTLSPVKVAIVDSGIDAGHPEFAGKIIASRSFVGGSAEADQFGHGTFLAGEIAAATNNAEGIAGIAFPAQLLIAKVVRPDRSIALEAEAAAIHWAVDNGARVINLSLGGVRDPRNPRRDTFSRLEAAAVDYAQDRGAVVVAAVGNGDQAPSSPWPYASWPAALPHVVGVSAMARDGSVPAFSNRDPIFVDVAAPGQDIFSTFPRQLTAQRPTCADQGYSDCGPDDYRHAEGTSFAAPQVTATAALLFAANPKLTAEQVTAIVERAAADATPGNGCRRCVAGRDLLTGWGRLDVASAIGALAGPLPVRDRLETNDDAGARAPRLWGGTHVVRATIDFWDDQIDVYRVKLRRGQRLDVRLAGPPAANANLVLWRPGTSTVEGLSLAVLRNRVAQAATAGASQRLGYRAPGPGWYYVEVKLATAGSGPYTLSYVKR